MLLHLALNGETAGLVDNRFLELMRPEAILVDTARLGLLDEHAVAEALDQGRLGGLALDAILPSGSPITRFVGDRRVVVTPHVGWYSEASSRTLRERAIGDALERALHPRS